MRRLVVTADDFGAAVEVNEAVERAHRDGILTAASLMVSGAAAADAVARAKAMPTLGVGLHLVLVDGRPTLPATRVPALVGSDGRFRDDMVAAAIRLFVSPAARAQLAAEIDAQFAAFAATGLPLDHVNAHKHFHLHPTIAATVIRVGRRYGMRTLRVPLERGGCRLERVWAARLQRRARAVGLCVPDQVVGLAWSGAFDAGRMRQALATLPPGLTEIYTHPATAAYPGSAPGYRYADELAALLDPEVKARLEQASEIAPRADHTAASPAKAGAQSGDVSDEAQHVVTTVRPAGLRPTPGRRTGANGITDVIAGTFADACAPTTAARSEIDR